MKRYMKPTTDIIYIETQKMIALSNGGIDEPNKVITPQEEEAISPGLSRGGRGFWDDEEDY